jgi:hypothetical protein
MILDVSWVLLTYPKEARPVMLDVSWVLLTYPREARPVRDDARDVVLTYPKEPRPVRDEMIFVFVVDRFEPLTVESVEKAILLVLKSFTSFVLSTFEVKSRENCRFVVVLTRFDMAIVLER